MGEYLNKISFSICLRPVIRKFALLAKFIFSFVIPFRNQVQKTSQLVVTELLLTLLTSLSDLD